MVKSFRCVQYNSFGERTVVAVKTDNVSSIIDKMIRVTAKITEMYASDIVYDIESLNKAVKEKNDFKRLLLFREGGVSSKDVESFNNVEWDICESGIQCWTLEYSPTTGTTIFERVLLVKNDN